MRRLTTPTHYFRIDIDAATMAAITQKMITYAQDGNVILNKCGDDVKIENGYMITRLTQEETKRFRHNRRVEMQIRCLTNENESLVSNIMTDDCERVLNDEVMV